MSSAALIAGNTVVLKPSEEAPWTGAILGEIVRAAGLPRGCLQRRPRRPGDGPRAGRRRRSTAWPSPARPRSAARSPAALQDGPYARPALTEMGGKNPAIVTAERRPRQARRRASRARRSGSRGRSAAPARARSCVDAVHDEFVERARRVQRRPRRSATPPTRDAFLGPVVNEAQRRPASRTRWRRARRDGDVAAGGGRPERPGHFVEPTVVIGPAARPPARARGAVPAVRHRHARRLVRRGDRRGERPRLRADRRHLQRGRGREGALPRRRSRPAWSTSTGAPGATTGAWPGTQTFCGWKSSGSTGKGGLGPYYLPQFMREQSRTVVELSAAASSANTST